MRIVPIVFLTACTLSLFTILSITPAIADEPNDVSAVADSVDFTLGEVGGYLAGERSSTKRVYAEKRFTDSGGHGFVAEEVNNFSDRLKGRDAKVVGYNNEANGPDRRIINRDDTTTWIQDKYYSSAKSSVSAAFSSETGNYRYIKDGKPMQLEVPADQYTEAVELMKEKIANGKVPGVSNPSDAKSIVRKGAITYEQAVKISKAGNIPSLTYDAKRGFVNSSCAFGISFGIDFVLCLNQGLSPVEAAGEAAKNGALAGSAVFASDVITSQLMKTGVPELLAPRANAVTRWIGKDACEALVSSAKGGSASITREELAAQASRILVSKGVFTGVFTAVLTVPDALDLVQGRISQGQFVKNLAVVVAAIAAGEAGAVAGTLVIKVPVLGTTAGSIIGSIVGAGVGLAAADVLANQFFKDDSEEMYRILTNRFAAYCEEYAIGNADAELLVDKLDEKLDSDTLKDMFAAENREAFANGLIEPLFEELIYSRSYEEIPSDYVIRTDLLDRLQGIVYLH